MLTESVDDGRQLLREVLAEPFTFTRDGQTYKLRAASELGKTIAGMIAREGEGPEFVASPNGTVLSYQTVFQGIWVSDRRAA